MMNQFTINTHTTGMAWPKSLNKYLKNCLIHNIETGLIDIFLQKTNATLAITEHMNTRNQYYYSS